MKREVVGSESKEEDYLNLFSTPELVARLWFLFFILGLNFPFPHFQTNTNNICLGTKYSSKSLKDDRYNANLFRGEGCGLGFLHHMS